MATNAMKYATINLLKWIQENRVEFLAILIILGIGAFLRIFRIGEYMTFLGDEGRDVIVVRRLLVNFDPILVGPGTSVGNMYLGPAYYYLIALPLLFANYSPVGPSVFVAVVGVATILLVWFVSRKWYGSMPAIVASILYATSPSVITLSRSSWNPNIMPFFALFTVWSMWKVWKENKFSWLICASVSYAFVLQSHYLGLILLPILFLVVIFSFSKSIKEGKQRTFLKYLFKSIFIQIFAGFPLAIFDARYGWRNFVAMKNFFFGGSGGIVFEPTKIVINTISTYKLIFSRLIGGQIDSFITPALITFVLVWFLFFFKEKFHESKYISYILLFSWLFVGILGLSFYGNEIYDHYFGFLFPAPFFVVALLYSKLLRYNILVVKVVLGITFIILLFLNVSRLPLLSDPGRQMQRTIDVANKMIEIASGERFNIAVIADQNYEGAYQYFLEKENAPFVIIDPQRYDETIADILFVVCEYEDKSKCQPVSNPKAEVANFGWSKIEDSYEIDGVILFKLVHNHPQ